MEAMLSVIVMVVSCTTTPAFAVLPPECDDGVDSTHCCPLDDLDYALGPEDWYHCLDKLPTLDLETRSA